MDSSYSSGQVLYDDLDLLLPSGLTLPANARRLAGYDVDYSRLVLNRMLGLNTTYITQATFGEMYIALREGDCDLAVSAVEFNPERAMCTAACPVVAIGSNTPLMGDYKEDGEWSDITLNKLCCLDYGAPYMSLGFSLASRTTNAPPSVMTTLLSPEVCNIATVAATMMFIVGWAICFCEWRVNPELATVDRGTLWSMSMLTTMGFADTAPRTRLGRALGVVWTVVSVVTISTFTSIIGSKLTVSSIAVGAVNGFGDVRGTLCVEQSYPTALEFVARSSQRPSSVIEGTVPACMAKLVAGTVAAVLTDRPVLAWYKNTYGLGDIYVSPVLAPNPFSFVYASGSPLRQYINPTVIAAQTDPNWIGLSEQLVQRDFGGDDTGDSGIAPAAPFEYSSIISAAVLAFATCMMAILNGNACPTMPERVQHAFCAPPRPGPAGDAMVELNEALEIAAEKLGALRDAVYHAGAHTAGNGDPKWAALDAWKGSGRFSNLGSPRTARSALDPADWEAGGSGSKLHVIPRTKLGSLSGGDTPDAEAGQVQHPLKAPPIQQVMMQQVQPFEQLPPLPPPATLPPLRVTPSPQQRPPSAQQMRPPSAPPARAWPPQAGAAAANGHRHRRSQLLTKQRLRKCLPRWRGPSAPMGTATATGTTRTQRRALRASREGRMSSFFYDSC
jgi:ABC-type amino acid transport substrate-binding protein